MTKKNYLETLKSVLGRSIFHYLHYCYWQDHSQNSCHNQLGPLILSVQDSMVASQIFQSQSFFLFLTQYQTKKEIRLGTFCQIRWSKNELDGIAYSTVLKRERNLSLHGVMKFCNLTVRKIRFIMVDNCKYRQKLWNVLDTFSQYWWAVWVYLFG